MTPGALTLLGGFFLFIITLKQILYVASVGQASRLMWNPALAAGGRGRGSISNTSGSLFDNHFPAGVYDVAFDYSMIETDFHPD